MMQLRTIVVTEYKDNKTYTGYQLIIVQMVKNR